LFRFSKGVGEKGGGGGGFAAGRNGDTRSGFGGNNGFGDLHEFGAEAGGGRRVGVGALCRIGGKQGGLVGGGPLGAAFSIQSKSGTQIACNQWAVPTGESIDVGHHACRSVHDVEEVP
jgi:hypothetical protein